MQETSLSDPTELEQTLDFTIGVEADGFSGWLAWQAGHGHNLAADDNNKAGTGTDPHFTHRHNMELPCRRSFRAAALRFAHLRPPPSKPE